MLRFVSSKMKSEVELEFESRVVNLIDLNLNQVCYSLLMMKFHKVHTVSVGPSK